MSNYKTFFIVDDDADDQELFIEAVHEVDRSIQCLAASDCEEAIDMLKTRKIPLPDIIFLDLNLPRLNGKQCLEAIKKEDDLKHIPIIIYSTSCEKRDLEETRRLGASYFLVKPNKFAELCKSIEYVLETDWRLYQHS